MSAIRDDDGKITTEGIAAKRPISRYLVRDFLRQVAALNQAERQDPFAVNDPQKSIRCFYDALANRTTERRFWNWGFHDDSVWRDTKPFVSSGPDARSDGLSEQLYCYAATTGTSPDDGSSLLEIGCGLGDGLAFLARKRPEWRYRGIDISENAVTHARHRFASTRVGFECGSAEYLPGRDGSIDIALSVESAHNYTSLPAFLSEAKRLLRPGGRLSIVDIFTRARMAQLDDALRDSASFERIIDHDISAGVRRAIAMRVAALDAGRAVRHAASGKGWWHNRIQDEGRKLMFGADFLAARPSTARRLIKRAVFGAEMPVDSYRHILLVRR